MQSIIVLMLQVENETGLQGAAREHSDYADELFSQNVPGEFRNGAWRMYRRLNGDEVANMQYDRPTLLRIKLFSYC